MSDLFKLMLIGKEEGITSFSSLSKIKKEYRPEKVGHAGTLDKFASGLMLVMIGSATKLNPLFSSFSKKYIATIEFGSETSTLDPEGDVVAISKLPEESDLINSISLFEGKQKQVPPKYSALHINGKRAYEEARKGNEIEMPERDIEVYSIDLVSFDGSKAEISCHVSKGTYIRSLARDIAIKAGSRGHLVKLERTAIGPWSLSDIGKDTKDLLDMTDMFSDVILNEKNKKKIENGNLGLGDILSDSDLEKPFCYLYFGNSIFGIGDKRNGFRIVTRIANGNL